ncbi:MAG: hypothetical protein QUU85_14345 [Candidatus Eisenbacteria bacterium]|nr:hypothetical protein [Candidatus Eisenbacteria bacterium]
MCALLAIGLTLFVFSPACAQIRSELATERAQLQSDRQAIVAANLPLTEEEAAAFWPLYREYREEIQKQGDRLIDIMLEYAKDAENLSEEQAASLLDDFLAVQRDELKIKAEWVDEFREILPQKSVTRFFQIENKIDATLRYEAADLIPLVEVEPE